MRSTLATRSSSARLMARTPWVLRPLERMSSTRRRMVMPSLGHDQQAVVFVHDLGVHDVAGLFGQRHRLDADAAADW